MKGWGIALVVAGVLASAGTPAVAGYEDAITPVEQYTTAKGKGLAATYKAQLVEFYEHIYHCLPWLGVHKNGIGFRQPKGVETDDRYLALWVTVDQDEDPQFAKLPAARRASAMFSRYGVDMLRRMSLLGGIAADANVTGFSVVLSWLKPGTIDSKQPISETLALFIDKTSLREFLAKRLPAAEFTTRARFNLFEGKEAVGRVPLEVWDDNFNRTYKLKNYQVEQGHHC